MQLGWVEYTGVEHKGIVLWSSKTRYMVKSEEQHAKHNTVKGSPASIRLDKLKLIDIEILASTSSAREKHNETMTSS